MTDLGRTILAVVPARGGSKSLPMKNIASLAGKPLITYTAEAALAAPDLDRVVLTTDSEEIAEVGRALGLEVPFMRPAPLARDETPGIDPIVHALEELGSEGYVPDLVMVLQPTSPLRSAEDIGAAVALLERHSADAVVSVCKPRNHPYWMKKMDSRGRVSDLLPLDREYTRRQDLDPVFAVNGAIFLARRDVLMEQRTYYTENTFAYVMPPERSIDIDSELDMVIAETMLLRAT